MLPFTLFTCIVISRNQLEHLAMRFAGTINLPMKSVLIYLSFQSYSTKMYNKVVHLNPSLISFFLHIKQ